MCFMKSGHAPELLFGGVSSPAFSITQPNGLVEIHIPKSQPELSLLPDLSL